MASVLLFYSLMTATLDLVYRYRQFVGKCEAGVGLDFDEIEALSRIEVLFARGDHSQDTDLWACQREFLREWVDFPATLRTRRYQDRVRITNLGPGGLVCAHAPFAQEGDTIEVIIDDDDLGLSYRFKGTVTWTRDDDEDCTLGLRFIGVPVRLRYGLARLHRLDVDSEPHADASRIDHRPTEEYAPTLPEYPAFDEMTTADETPTVEQPALQDEQVAAA